MIQILLPESRSIICITSFPMSFCKETKARDMKLGFRQLSLINCYLKDDMERSVVINWSGHQRKHADGRARQCN